MKLILPKSSLSPFVESLLASYEIIGPVGKMAGTTTRFVFDAVGGADELSPDYDTTLLPPVKWLYPNDEIVYEFDVANHKADHASARPVTNAPGRALLFVHPCDIHAIKVMDEVLSEASSDPNYLARRRAALIIGLSCQRPCKTETLCFDKSTHIATGGYDIMLTAQPDDPYYADEATEKGRNAVRSCSLFKGATTSERRAMRDAAAIVDKNFKKVLDAPVGKLSEALKGAYDDDVWKEEGERCLSCGACNIVCPTCYCFDTGDDVSIDMKSGVRVRRWDSCQFRSFCEVASGENFRDSADARLRHRLFKKEVYLKKRFGLSGCVGCGRCITHCIAKISIIDIYNKVTEG